LRRRKAGYRLVAVSPHRVAHDRYVEVQTKIPESQGIEINSQVILSAKSTSDQKLRNAVVTRKRCLFCESSDRRLHEQYGLLRADL
jgi:hypothetical protein